MQLPPLTVELIAFLTAHKMFQDQAIKLTSLDSIDTYFPVPSVFGFDSFSGEFPPPGLPYMCLHCGKSLGHVRVPELFRCTICPLDKRHSFKDRNWAHAQFGIIPRLRDAGYHPNWISYLLIMYLGAIETKQINLSDWQNYCRQVAAGPPPPPAKSRADELLGL